MKLIFLSVFLSACASAQGIIVKDISGTHQAAACPSQIRLLPYAIFF
jgi:hypothetical protein